MAGTLTDKAKTLPPKLEMPWVRTDLNSKSRESKRESKQEEQDLDQSKINTRKYIPFFISTISSSDVNLALICKGQGPVDTAVYCGKTNKIVQGNY